MNLFEVFIAILAWGLIYTLAKTGTYYLMSQIELNNLEIIWRKLPGMLKSGAKYLKSKKFKKTLKDLEEAITSLTSEPVERLDLEPDQEEE